MAHFGKLSFCSGGNLQTFIIHILIYTIFLLRVEIRPSSKYTTGHVDEYLSASVILHG